MIIQYPYLIKKTIQYNKNFLFKILTAPIRTVPDFLIIGTAKGGTTSMYNYLIQHPNVIKALKKEIYYFAYPTFRLKFSFFWYKSHFPTKIEKRNKITGEAEPNTIFHPLAPQRVKKFLPNVKLIILLRNPIDRAYSAWNMHYTKKIVDLSFEESLEREKYEYAGMRKKLIQNENFWNQEYMRFAYLEKGIYVDQLNDWFKFFPKNQIHIVRSEDFATNTCQILSNVYDFLDIPQASITNIEKKHVGNYKQKINPETRKKLIEFFKPHNERLYKYLGKNFHWDI